MVCLCTIKGGSVITTDGLGAAVLFQVRAEHSVDGAIAGRIDGRRRRDQEESP
jgi:hypothetical protein